MKYSSESTSSIESIFGYECADEGIYSKSEKRVYRTGMKTFKFTYIDHY